LFLDIQELGLAPEIAPRGGRGGEEHHRARSCSLLVLDNFSFGSDDPRKGAAAQGLILTRLRTGRITLLTSAGPLSLRRGSVAPPLEPHSTGEFPGVGPTTAAMRLLSGFKVLRMHAEDRGRDQPGAFPLFGDSYPDARRNYPVPKGHCA
jgi:hypothetical protein